MLSLFYCWGYIYSVGLFPTKPPFISYSVPTPVFVLLCHTEGCPGLCNGNGRCTLGNNGWYCVCQLGWRGTGCDTSMETACSDVKDNDGGKITNNTQLYLLTLAERRRGHETQFDSRFPATFERIPYLLYAFQARLCSSIDEGEKWLPVSHLDNRFFIFKKKS